LVAVPQKSRAYKGLAIERLGLHRAAHVDSYRGLIFANLDPDAPPLADYLGDFRWYLDLHLGLGGGMDVIGEPNRWRIDADWKTAAENFCGDSYHTQTLHRSISEQNLIPKGGVGTGGTFDVHITEISGHATSMRRTGPGTNTLFGYPDDLKRHLTMPDLSESQREIARGSLLHTGTVFPNLSFIHLPAIDSPERQSVSYFGLRQWQPKGPGRMEAMSWVLVPRVASADYRRRAYKASVASFGPSGNFEQDDTIVWSSIARAAKTLPARRGAAKLNFQMGMDGMSEAARLSDWPGPGEAWNTNLEEGVQRTFFRHWLRAMERA
jgi:phenylpropionate dioxygenase-like ring-hydroxylating dioxygenase large terminal subunit